MLDSVAFLTPEQAAEHAGVPAVQLIRWAAWKNGSGPKNSGTWFKPRYLIEDVKAWRKEKQEKSK